MTRIPGTWTRVPTPKALVKRGRARDTCALIPNTRAPIYHLELGYTEAEARDSDTHFLVPLFESRSA